MTAREWARIWELVREPKTITVLMACLYAAAVPVGIWLLNQPRLDGWWDVMAIMLMLGGVIAAIGAPFGHWWLERSGLILLGTSQLMRWLIVADYPSVDKAAALWSITAAVALIVTRWIRIRALPRDPQRG